MSEDKILLDKHTQSLVRQYDLGGGSLKALADFFGVLSDSTRIRLVSALGISPMCVGDLSTLLGINQTTVSHQLRTLRSIGVVDYSRQGRVVFYFLKNKAVLDVMMSATDFL